MRHLSNFNDFINEGSDPRKGTGKKPKGSGRRLYTDENPSDTVPVKFRTKEDVQATVNSKSFKSKSHQRQSQILNLIEQRLRVAVRRAKDPNTKSRFKRAHDYAVSKCKDSKEKTRKMNENFTKNPNQKNPEIKIVKINSRLENEVVDFLYEVFGFLEKDKESLRKRISPRLSNGISIALLIGGKIEGCYLLNVKSAEEFIEEIKQNKIKDFPVESTRIYYKKRIKGIGIQGIALAVNSKFRKMGLGNLLKKEVKSMGYDYIWGVSDKKLENIEHWKKERELLAESPERWATIEFLSPLK